VSLKLQRKFSKSVQKYVLDETFLSSSDFVGPSGVLSETEGGIIDRKAFESLEFEILPDAFVKRKVDVTANNVLQQFYSPTA